MAKAKQPTTNGSAPPDPKRVFIGYGRNLSAYTALVRFLHTLRLDPLSFEEIRNELGGSPYIGEIVQEGMRRAHAVLVLFTPDEFSCLRPSFRLSHEPAIEASRWQSRPNVLLEAGMALAFGRNRTILLLFGDVRLPSDLSGLHVIPLNNSPTARERLRNALAGVGCGLFQGASGLHDIATSGDFEGCLSTEDVTPGDAFQNINPSSGEKEAKEEPELAERDGFLTKEGVLRMIPESGLVNTDERVLRCLLLYRTNRQRTWLVATNK